MAFSKSKQTCSVPDFCCCCCWFNMTSALSQLLWVYIKIFVSFNHCSFDVSWLDYHSCSEWIRNYKSITTNSRVIATRQLNVAKPPLVLLWNCLPPKWIFETTKPILSRMPGVLTNSVLMFTFLWMPLIWQDELPNASLWIHELVEKKQTLFRATWPFAWHSSWHCPPVGIICLSVCLRGCAAGGAHTWVAITSHCTCAEKLGVKKKK